MTGHAVKLIVNGSDVEVSVEPRESLLDVLRDHLGLTGTHGACEQGACGACSVLVDGSSVLSCLLFGVQAAGRVVTTIEGVAEGQALHPIQEAMHRHHGLQCGFCTPGMVMAALDLLATSGPLGREEIEAAMAGNLCRCTGYQPIVDAITEVAGRESVGLSEPVGVPVAHGEDGR